MLFMRISRSSLRLVQAMWSRLGHGRGMDISANPPYAPWRRQHGHVSAVRGAIMSFSMSFRREWYRQQSSLCPWRRQHGHVSVLRQNLYGNVCVQALWKRHYIVLHSSPSYSLLTSPFTPPSIFESTHPREDTSFLLHSTTPEEPYHVHWRSASQGHGQR